MSTSTATTAPSAPSFAQTVVAPDGNAPNLQSTMIAPTTQATQTSSGSQTMPLANASPGAAAGGHRYEVMRQLGEGGMGEVVLSRDPTIGRQVAIKRMKKNPVETDAGAGRFMAEVQMTGKLEHPGIVPVYDAGREADGTPYFVMKYVRAQKNAAISRSFEGDYMPPSGDLHHARRAPTSSPGITLGSDCSSGGPRWET